MCSESPSLREFLAFVNLDNIVEQSVELCVVAGLVEYLQGIDCGPEKLVECGCARLLLEIYACLEVSEIFDVFLLLLLGL